MKRFWILLLAVLCTSSCNWFGPGEKDRQVVLVYFAGNNSLSSEGEGDYEDLCGAWLPEGKDKHRIVLIYRHFIDRTPVLSRIYRDRKGVLVEETIQEYPFDTNSATPQTLSNVLADAEEAWPAEHHGLILWSHASGFLPEGYYAYPAEHASGGASLMSFAEDHGTEMDLKDLRKALSRFHYDFIVFDCCLMANVEVAYELRNCADYLLFSPTEILSDGFPYEQMIQPIFEQKPEMAMTTICQRYMEHYRAQSGVYRSATISLVNTAALGQLAAACKTIFNNHQDQIMTVNRGDIQAYFRFNKHWFYDIDDFVRRVATDAEYQAFSSALSRSVIYKDATENFLSIHITHYSGLSSYIPRPEYTVLNNYYKTLQWNQATGLVP